MAGAPEPGAANEDSAAAAPVAEAGLRHLMLTKMSLHDGPEAFVEPFEHAAEACTWGEPSLQKVSGTLEQHRQCFRFLMFSELSHLFAFAQQLPHACQRCLLAKESDANDVTDLVVLE